jgi:hypothetical protein
MHATRILAASATLALGFLAAPAWADTKVMAGSTCESTFFSGLQFLFRSNGQIVSSSGGNVSVTCPIVKDANRITRAEVRIIDRNGGSGPDDNVTCTLQTLRIDGTVQQSQTQKSNNRFDTPLPLFFGAQSAAPGGSYLLVCDLPPFAPGSGPSSIASYTIVEG